MARRPTPCGQRTQPLFARSENVEKKTVKKILNLFGLHLVRQQPTSLGLRRDSPEDRLLGTHPVRKDPTGLAKGRTGTLKQRIKPKLNQLPRKDRRPASLHLELPLGLDGALVEDEVQEHVLDDVDLCRGKPFRIGP